MAERTTRLLLVLAAFVAGLASVFAVVLVVSGREPGAVATPAAAIGGPFQLTDQTGRTVTHSDFRGRPYLVFFGYTHCPDACPSTLFDISEVLGKLGPDAERVSALFITIDPERDTPEQLKEYLSNFNPRLTGLTGDPAAITAVAKEYRVYARKVPTENGDYTIDHTALVYLMDKDGRFVAPFNLKRTPEDAAADLRRYL
jgi:protein SCO1/2